MAENQPGPFRVISAERPDAEVARWVTETGQPAVERIEGVGASHVWALIEQVWDRALEEGLVEGTSARAIEIVEATAQPSQAMEDIEKTGRLFADRFALRAAEITRRSAQDEVSVEEYRQRIGTLAEIFGAPGVRDAGLILEDRSGLSFETRAFVDAETETALAATFNQSILNRFRTEPTIRLYPYLTYVTRRDSRVRPAHRLLDGFTARTGNGIWNRLTPPLGFRCRCVLVASDWFTARGSGFEGEFPFGVGQLSGFRPDPGF